MRKGSQKNQDIFVAVVDKAIFYSWFLFYNLRTIDL